LSIVLHAQTLQPKPVIVIDLDTPSRISDDVLKAAQAQGTEEIWRDPVDSFIHEFTSSLIRNNEIWVWTMSSQASAQAMVKKLDPTGSFISRCLSLKHCTCRDGGRLIKDLSTFGRKDIRFLNPIQIPISWLHFPFGAAQPVETPPKRPTKPSIFSFEATTKPFFPHLKPMQSRVFFHLKPRQSRVFFQLKPLPRISPWKTPMFQMKHLFNKDAL
jgi:hypothetical protein